jgi:hydrogenase/urease accessory protein HupE
VIAWGRIAVCVVSALLALLAALPALAHEVRPAYLELRETAPGHFSVLWRTPILAGVRLPVVLKLPDSVRNVRDPAVQDLTDSLIERRWVDTGPAGLAGLRIEFPGLQLTITDALVRVQMLDGVKSTSIVRPAQPWIEIAASPTGWKVAGTYLYLGVEHILSGVDHLLFILALVLLVQGWKRLVGTITAFTVAHSITLVAATLGLVTVPAPPVEACIALSVVFVASELVRGRHGDSGMVQRWPWLVAFAFGLLHGFGFAGSLSEVGLPPNAIPLALAFFNIGVELGQLVFIGVVLGVIAASARVARRVRVPRPEWAWRVLPYAIGSLAAFWVIERIAAF